MSNRPLRPSDVIGHFTTEIQSGDKVVLWMRESIKQNDSKLKQQEQELRRECNRRGVTIVALPLHIVPRHIVHGYDHDDDSLKWSEELVKAVEIARKRDAKLVATETDRFLRRPYDSSESWPNALGLPRSEDLERFQQLTNGVRCLTLQEPDATPEANRGQQTRRGLQHSTKRAGRPLTRNPGYLVQRKSKKLSEVQELHENNYSLNEIFKQTGVPRSTSSRWLRQPR